MPRPMVESDLASGALVEIVSPDWNAGTQMQMRAVHRTDRPPGPAGRWLIESLKETVSQCPGHESADEAA
jgi:DNA-binding transcriptional LysR family regulator